ncbi:hypothetical protein BDA99DRAFT_575683 [Phascolomyces articulosus]|uniref:CUE domain-containing protein n=1 Tax=Phascolomyces articulosus TaxID=60185 RepID=A0AAD5K0D8_9FUNG|nr:hypothetical protein BDA99DRAFT_575683 [Phascolomyces articulosus]
MIDFLPFLPQGHDGVTNEIYQIARDAWLYQLKSLLDAQDDQEFLSEITHNESLHGFVTAVLNNQLDGHTIDTEISKRVFLVYIRAVRLNENSSDTPLFTAEQLSSFAVIYGESNPSQVRELFSKVVSSNSKLANQLNETIVTLATCLELATGASNLGRLYVIVRLLEALVSATVTTARSTKKKDDMITALYRSILVCYDGALATASKGKESTMTATSPLYRIKYALLRTWHHIMHTLYLDPLLDISLKEDVQHEIIDAFSEKLLFWIEEGNIEQTRQGFVDAPLVMDWIVSFSISETLDTINKEQFHGDEERIEFLKLSTEQIQDMSIPVVKESKKQKTKRPPIVASTTAATDTTISQQQVDDVVIHEVANISQVHDLFPDLGEGFIQACLQHHNNDVEVVIMELLDNNLPEPLNSMDRTLKELPPPPSPEPIQNKQSSILESRRNIFDNDEFDLLSRQPVAVDKRKMHMGTRDRGTADTMLQDQSFIKSEKQNMLERIHRMYEEEYDDTYDGINETGPVDLEAVENDDATDVVRKSKENPAAAGSVDEGLLANAYVYNRDWFHRSNRKLRQRQELQQKTGMSEEQFEGWAIMMDRNPRRQKILDRYMLFDATQAIPNGTTTTQSNSNKQRSQQPRSQNNKQSQQQSAAKNKQPLQSSGAKNNNNKQQQSSGTKNEQQQKRTPNNRNSKSRSANHHRKQGHDKKMAKAGLGAPSDE